MATLTHIDLHTDVTVYYYRNDWLQGEYDVIAL